MMWKGRKGKGEEEERGVGEKENRRRADNPEGADFLAGVSIHKAWKKDDKKVVLKMWPCNCLQHFSCIASLRGAFMGGTDFCSKVPGKLIPNYVGLNLGHMECWVLHVAIW
jgi:hypothetical protein